MAWIAVMQVACGGGNSGVQVAIKPAQVTLAPGATQQFTASVTNTSNDAVTWQVNGIDGGNGAVGTIDASGLYTAPAGATVPSSVTVMAVSKADSSKSASATVALAGGTTAFSNASLQGAYVFQWQGVSTAMAGAQIPVAAAGRFVADGNGTITSGSEDLNDGAAAKIQTLTFTGTYSVHQDGRGTLSLTVPSGTLTFSFALRSDGTASLLTTPDNLIGFGQAAPQDANALTPASLAGTYAFQQTGSTNISGTVGPYAATGVLALNASGAVSSGSEDANNQGTVHQNLTVTGSYAMAGVPGRVEFTLHSDAGDTHMAAYIASSSRLLWVETDFPFPVTSGEMERQTGGSFSAASLGGTAVFRLLGTSLNHIVAQAGEWHADASGTVSSGEYDENNTGTIVSAAPISGGSDQVGSDGRFTLTLQPASGGAIKLAGVLISAQSGFITGLDTTVTGHGEFFQQAAPASSSGFSAADLHAALTGVLTGVTGQGPQNRLMQLTADGAGGLGGTADEHLTGTVSPNQQMGGTYTLDAGGRGVMTLTLGGATHHLVFYWSGTHAEIANQDASELLSGTLGSQF